MKLVLLLLLVICQMEARSLDKLGASNEHRVSLQQEENGKSTSDESAIHTTEQTNFSVPLQRNKEDSINKTWIKTLSTKKGQSNDSVVEKSISKVSSKVTFSQSSVKEELDKSWDETVMKNDSTEGSGSNDETRKETSEEVLNNTNSNYEDDEDKEIRNNGRETMDKAGKATTVTSTTIIASSSTTSTTTNTSSISTSSTTTTDISSSSSTTTSASTSSTTIISEIENHSFLEPKLDIEIEENDLEKAERQGSKSNTTNSINCNSAKNQSSLSASNEQVIIELSSKTSTPIAIETESPLEKQSSSTITPIEVLETTTEKLDRKEPSNESTESGEKSAGTAENVERGEGASSENEERPLRNTQTNSKNSGSKRLKLANGLNSTMKAIPKEEPIIGCRTNGGRFANLPCIFPFMHRNVTYHSCTFALSFVTQNRAWCSVQTNEKGEHVKGKWGTCDPDNCLIPPRECGQPARGRLLPLRSDEVRIHQLPWMVSIGHVEESGQWQHQCGGSLVTHRHVVTAAHCLNFVRPFTQMMLGADKLNVTGDQNPNRLIVDIAKFRQHPDYRVGRMYYDVGVVTSHQRIEYTDYIRPLCLPFRAVDDQDDLADGLVSLAGWGRDNSNFRLTNSLVVENIRVNGKSYCDRVFSSSNLKYKHVPLFKVRRGMPQGMSNGDIICAGTEILNIGACQGDSGSPLIRLVSDSARRQPYYELTHVVSDGVSCRLEATLYVRVHHRRVLDFLQRETDTMPLLMVIGGYNSEKGLLNDIELISTRRNNACSRRVRPLPGRSFDLGTHVEHEASTLGMTGQVAKDSVMVCGGKTGDNNQNKCYVYQPDENRWIIGLPMQHRRYYAASTLDEAGNLWVLGGLHGSHAADSTEIFDLRRKKWRRGRPMPEDLRLSGLSSHCAVRINKTHAFMAGGYAHDYVIPNIDFPDQPGIFVGGRSFRKAYMFDGFYWEPMPDMDTVRDRPACSLLPMPDGRLHILVAGGCAGWCANTPPLDSAQIFDPDNRQWSKAAALPKPLSSAKMELLDGLATIVGGYDNVTQNDKLYQYRPIADAWVEHPWVRMRVPRSSAAVFQVPHSMFPHC